MTSSEHQPPSGASGDSGVSSPAEPDLRIFFKTLAASFAYSQGSRRAHLAGESSENPRPKEEGQRAAPRSRLLPTLLVGLAGVVLAWIGPLLLPVRDPSVPDALVGAWETSAQSYSDRGFMITKTSLVLKAGPQGKEVSTHPITRVRTTDAGGLTVYTIEYLVERAVYEFSFHLSTESPPVIRLVNQPEVAWRKEGGDRRAVRPKVAR